YYTKSKIKIIKRKKKNKKKNLITRKKRQPLKCGKEKEKNKSMGDFSWCPLIVPKYTTTQLCGVFV
ncbi:hypothetical protein PP707_04515, partial [Acetobacter pasteurianus]|nr:hypothetical protein [Acetobacter pasteurianus]